MGEFHECFFDHYKETEIIALLVRWAESQPGVRAMLLTSTRAIPGTDPPKLSGSLETLKVSTASDVFSDYDVILALSDVRPFFEDRTWLEAFGRVLVLYRDPLEPEQGYLKSGYVIQFEDGLKIDFNLWPVELLQHIAAAPNVETQDFVSDERQDFASLRTELDAGYRVLLDKDGLTGDLKPPTYRAYIPTPPTETEYREVIEVALLEAIYVAKYLWRDDLMAAKYVLDNFLKQEHLRPMLEWHYEIDHGWSVKPGPYGRRMKKWLRADLWADLESTYAGPGLEENWDALFRAVALLRKAAVEVGERLGFAYPYQMEERTLEYLQKVRDQDR